MEREELLKSPIYWETKAQIEIWEAVREYCIGRGDDEVMAHLKIKPNKFREIKNGDWKGSMFEYFRIFIALGKIPIITIQELKDQE